MKPCVYKPTCPALTQFTDARWTKTDIQTYCDTRCLDRSTRKRTALFKCPDCGGYHHSSVGLYLDPRSLPLLLKSLHHKEKP